MWQCIMQGKDGGWDGYYTNGKGRLSHKELAGAWSSSPGAHMKCHCLGKGVTHDCVDTLLDKSFTLNAIREAGGACFTDGKVLTQKQVSMNAMLRKIDNSWLDIGKGIPKKKP